MLYKDYALRAGLAESIYIPVPVIIFPVLPIQVESDLSPLSSPDQSQGFRNVGSPTSSIVSVSL